LVATGLTFRRPKHYSSEDQQYLENVLRKRFNDRRTLEELDDANLRWQRSLYLGVLVVWLVIEFAWRLFTRSDSFTLDVVERHALSTTILVTILMPLIYGLRLFDDASVNKIEPLVPPAFLYSLIEFTETGIRFAAVGAFWGAIWAVIITSLPSQANTTLWPDIATYFTNGAIFGTFLACAYVVLSISPSDLALGGRYVRDHYRRGGLLLVLREHGAKLDTHVPDPRL
jgi:hypothetical protein